MTTKRIIWSGGGVLNIFNPASQKDVERDLNRKFKNEKEYVSFLKARIVPDTAANVLICDVVDIPTDLTFRDAWKRGALPVEINMPKARDIHMDHIREAREPELARLDKEWMRATGQKNTIEADEIEARRQHLRDLPQTLDLTTAKTPERLKTLWPKELPSRNNLSSTTV